MCTGRSKLFLLKMFDTERFITEVQNRLCLWNLKEKSYSDRPAKRRAWEEIAEILLDEWETYDTKTKNESSKLMFILLHINILIYIDLDTAIFLHY